jgi:SAM-dependent methyltransferase
MAHQEQRSFCEAVKRTFPRFFRNVSVLEVGSLDINGSIRDLFQDCDYTGIDLGEGKGVDVICPGNIYRKGERDIYDVVVSTECFEHDMHFRETFQNMYDLLKPGGLFFFTCASDGRPEHGTKRTDGGYSAPLLGNMGSEWEDYYMNVNESHIRDIMNIEESFIGASFQYKKYPGDLYFWGIKNIQ